jgi:hypothetical protein
MNYSPDKAASPSHPLRLWQAVRPHARRIARIAWIAAIALTLSYIAYRIVTNWSQIRSYDWHIRPWNLVLAFVLYSAGLLLTALAWALIMRHISGDRAMLAHMRLFCLTNLANRLPTPLPFVGARTESYAARGIARSTTMLAMSYEVVTTLLGAMIIAGLTVGYGPGAQMVARAGVLAWLLPVPLVLLALRPALLTRVANPLLQRLGRQPLSAPIAPRDMLLWSGIFVLLFANSGVFYFIVAAGVYDLPASFIPTMLNITAVSALAGWLAQFAPVPALRQVVTAYLLSQFMPWPTAIAIAVLARLLVMIFELVWAAIFALLRH